MPRAERHYTIPTAMLSTDISGAMRIDHILANRGVRVEKAWVMRDGEADVASWRVARIHKIVTDKIQPKRYCPGSP
jgi:hypothetical protein